jgi:DNA-binding transcriptional regulator GbsR (MarR family)
MRLFTNISKNLRRRKKRYDTINVKRDTFITFKSLAAHRKKNQIDFFNDLLKFYVEAQQHNYEETIADLLEKQNALCDAIRIYQKRLGRVYDSPADQTPKSSSNVD